MQLSLFRPTLILPFQKTVCEDPRIKNSDEKGSGTSFTGKINRSSSSTGFSSQKVQLRISNTRTSKFGDYRPPRPGSIPRISVNHNLNKFAFLITLVHEMAHHMVLGGIHERHFCNLFPEKNRPKPHGTEWQSHYRILMDAFLNPAILPRDIIEVMKQYLENPKSFYDCRSKTFQGIKKVRSNLTEANLLTAFL